MSLLECRACTALNSKRVDFLVRCGRSGRRITGEYGLIVKSVCDWLRALVMVLTAGDSRRESVVDSWSGGWERHRGACCPFHGRLREGLTDGSCLLGKARVSINS